VTGASTFVQGTAKTAYVTDQNGGHFRSSNFTIGAANAASNAGFLTVENRGRISSSALLNGSLFIGGTIVQSAGTLLLQAGAITHALPNSVPMRVSRPPCFQPPTPTLMKSHRSTDLVLLTPSRPLPPETPVSFQQNAINPDNSMTPTNRSIRVRFTGTLRPAAALMAVLSLLPAFSGAQTTTNGPASEPALELPPFIISSSSDVGYTATDTLSGTRFKTNLYETPSSIQVLTKELLDDLNAESLDAFLQFSTSTDRDFGADPTGLTSMWTGSLVKIRGFSAVPVTRDYFSYGLALDRYNIDRVDVQRGPNSILYGIGGPGGVINSASKQARLDSRQKNEVSLTVGSFDKLRAEADFNLPLVKNKLALRLNLLREDKEEWQQPSGSLVQAYALAATYRPWKKTFIRAGYESVDREIINTNPYPVGDFGGATWYNAGAPLVGNPLQPQTNPQPTLLGPATLQQVLWAPQLRPTPFREATLGGADMRPDLAGNQLAGAWRTREGANVSPAGRSTDLALLDLIGKRTNIYGTGNYKDEDFSIASVTVNQEVLGFDLELAYSKLERSMMTYNNMDWNNGVFGDPNPVLPGRYLADGDATIAGGAFPGTQLPDVGAPNPQAGQLYWQAPSIGRDFEDDRNLYRATLSRTFDFTKRSRWFGSHTLAGLWQYDKVLSLTGPFQAYNVGKNNNTALHLAPNQILQRTYLDLSPGGIKYMADLRDRPIPAGSGVTPQYLWFNNVWNWRSSESEALMGVLQSKFLNNRLILTGGMRRDEQTQNIADAGAVFYPGSTALRTSPNNIFNPAKETYFSGNTRTFGAFFAATSWLGITYNNANSVQPQSQEDIYGDPLGVRDGTGADYGLRFRAFNGRVTLSATYYEASDSNQALTGGPNVQWIPLQQSMAAVFEASVEKGIPLPPRMKGQTAFVSRWDRWDFDGDGVELELVGNILPRWSVSMNYSKNNIASGKVYAPDHLAFVVDNKSRYDGNMETVLNTPGALATFIRARDGTPDRDFVTQPATFNDAYDYSVSIVDAVLVGQGKLPFGHSVDQFNFFTSYRFEKDSAYRLGNARIGLGANFRSAPVLGYDQANAGREIYGDSRLVWRLMLGKRINLAKQRYLDLQLNWDNMFASDDLVPYSAASPTKVDRYMFNRNIETWTLRATYGF